MDMPDSTRALDRPPVWTIEALPIAYQAAVAEMQAHVAAMARGDAGERVWMLEHPPLYTAGTSARPEDLGAPDRFPVFRAGRGGQWTYHGPGQRVAYVMLDLTRRHGTVAARDLHAYVAGLEAWLIAALARFGVRGELRDGRVGVWVVDGRTGAEAKIGAIGVRVTRWMSWHGVSLNVDPELDHFSGIVPCGVREHGVTSLRALGVAASMAEVDAVLMQCWRDVFGGASPMENIMGGL
jgi:lipoyl(octanoyl) transferase